LHKETQEKDLMFDRKFRLAAAFLVVFAAVSTSQRAYAADQSPRQAMIEMLSGGEAPFKKHLTLDMQSKLQDLMRGSPDKAPNPLESLIGASSDPNKFQAFDMGPILFSFNNPQQHERYVLQIDSEQQGREEDNMALSLRLVRNGVEQELPTGLRLLLNLKKQEGTWRLNAVTMSTTLFVGDPRFLEKTWWNPVWLAATGTSSDPTLPTTTDAADERPKMTPMRSVRIIGMAENIYAQQHPGIGFTCKLAELVDVGKGMDEEGMYKFIDPDFADGLYNGYKFILSGCERKPARAFRVTAEPLAGRGKAYCSDNLNNIRVSDDGRGTTCLAAGKIAHK
jgi:hypothetical protein